MGFLLPIVLASSFALRLASWLFFLSQLTGLASKGSEAGMSALVAFVLAKRLPAIAGSASGGSLVDRFGAWVLLALGFGLTVFALAPGLEVSPIVAVATLAFAEPWLRIPFQVLIARDPRNSRRDIEHAHSWLSLVSLLSCGVACLICLGGELATIAPEELRAWAFVLAGIGGALALAAHSQRPRSALALRGREHDDSMRLPAAKPAGGLAATIAGFGLLYALFSIIATRFPIEVYNAGAWLAPLFQLAVVAGSIVGALWARVATGFRIETMLGTAAIATALFAIAPGPVVGLFAFVLMVIAYSAGKLGAENRVLGEASFARKGREISLLALYEEGAIAIGLIGLALIANRFGLVALPIVIATTLIALTQIQGGFSWPKSKPILRHPRPRPSVHPRQAG